MLKKIHHYTIPHESNNYKPHSIRHGSLWVYSGLLIAVKIITLVFAFSLYPTPAEFSTITTNRIIELTNQMRLDQGLSQLKMSEVLNQVANLKIQDMIQNNYFAHTSPDGIKPWHWFKQVDYNYTYAGENLAMNFIEAEDTLRAWLDSPSHADNILSKNYDEIGVAVAIGEINGQETTVVVQLFGKRFVQVAGESFLPSSREVLSPPVGGAGLAGEITSQAPQQQVTLQKSSPAWAGWLTKIVKYSSRFFFVLLIFVLLNLLLTIFIRLEIQHKPVIFHALLVIILAAAMIWWKIHFIEGLGSVVVI